MLWLYTAFRLYVHGLKLTFGTSMAGIGAVGFNLIVTKYLADGGVIDGFDFDGQSYTCLSPYLPTYLPVSLLAHLPVYLLVAWLLERACYLWLLV